MKKTISKFAVLTFASLMFLTACGDGAGGGAGSGAGAAAPSNDLVIGTAAVEGTFHVLAVAMASAINNNTDAVTVTAQSTLGSVQNLNMVNLGELDMGMSNADGVYWASTGTGMFEELGEQNISAVMTLYMSAGQMAVMEGSGIESWSDLRGKRVVLGPAGTTIPAMSRAILEAYGIDPDNDIDGVYLSFAEGLSSLTDGVVDASFLVGGVPVAAMLNATALNDVTLLSAGSAQLDGIVAEIPFFQRFTIPAGTYPGVDHDVQTLKIFTEFFANNDVPEELIYQFVINALENVPNFVDAHVVAQEINAQTAASSVSRFHPGAIRAFRSLGVMD